MKKKKVETCRGIKWGDPENRDIPNQTTRESKRNKQKAYNFYFECNVYQRERENAYWGFAEDGVW